MPHPDSLALLASAKPLLQVHADAALNAETSPALLDAPLTPVPAFFVRNNGTLPAPLADPEAAWRLTIDGAVHEPLSLSLQELRQEFQAVQVTAVLECAGNGRAGFAIPTDGLQWGFGAVGCASWTGVRLGDLLRAAGLQPGAMYVSHHSGDRATDGPPGPALSRGLPLAKAMAPETLVAFAMNGEPLPFLHGAPLRIVAPGYPGSAWQKWLERVTVLDHEHDGVKMTGTDYRLPRAPLDPGAPWEGTPFDVITDMPVRAMITAPATDCVLPAGTPIPVRGFAWGGHTPPVAVAVSANAGRDWIEALLEPEPDGMPFGWRRFRAVLPPMAAGPIEIMARATDALGRSQPLDAAPWNPRGYCNNGVQRVRGAVSGER